MMRKAEEERKVTEDWVRDGVKKKERKGNGVIMTR